MEHHMTGTMTCLINKCALLNEGLKTILQESGYRPLVTMQCMDEFFKDRHHRYKLIIVSSNIIKEDAEDMIKRIKDHSDKSRIVILAHDIDMALISTAFKADLDGYISQDIPAPAFTASINLINMGQKLFPTNITYSDFQSLAQTQSRPDLSNGEVRNDLSDREMETILCLAKGQSNKIIANNLNITESTVKIHLKTILRKLGMKNRTQVAIWAVKQGFPNLALTAVIYSIPLLG